MATTTILEALQSLTAYPVPTAILQVFAAGRGVDFTKEITSDTLHSTGFNLAKADTLMWLASAPNVSQGGQSYSFTDEQRERFLKQAQALVDEYGDGAVVAGVRYGYKGSRL